MGRAARRFAFRENRRLARAKGVVTLIHDNRTPLFLNVFNNVNEFIAHNRLLSGAQEKVPLEVERM
jgi:hypothetical protein